MRKSFTLVEVLVVISIIVLLISIASIFIHESILKARDLKRIAEADILKKSLELYHLDNGKYPEILEWTSVEKDADEEGPFSQAMESYLSRMPRDPLYPKIENPGEENEKIYSFQYVSSEGGKDYKVHIETETEMPVYEFYSERGNEIVYEGTGDGSDTPPSGEPPVLDLPPIPPPSSEDYSLINCSEVSSVAAIGGASALQTANYMMEASDGTLYWAFGGSLNKAYLYFSTDQGVSWNKKTILNTPSSVYSAHLIEDVSGNLYWSFASDYVYLYRSVDNGNNWSQLKAFNTSSYAENLFKSSNGVLYWAIETSFIPKIYRSSDGINWTLQGQSGVGAEGAVYSVNLLETSNQYLYWVFGLLRKESIYRSIDGGITWTSSLAVSLGPGTGVDQHIIEGSDGNLYFSFGSSVSGDKTAYLYRSINKGENWVQIQKFLTGSDIYAPRLLEDFWGNLYWSFGELNNAHLYKSSNQGGNWEIKMDITSDVYGVRLANYLSKSYTNDGLYWVYTEEGSRGRAFLYESMDQGENWQEIKRIEVMEYGGNLGYAPETFLFEDLNQHLFWSFIADDAHMYRCDIPEKPREKTYPPQWAAFLHDPQNTGRNSSALPVSDNVSWTFQRENFFNATDWVMIGYDGTVYTATIYKIYALDPVTGQQKWNQPFAVSSGVKIRSSPVISPLVTKGEEIFSQSFIYVLLSYGSGGSKLIAIDSSNGSVVQEKDFNQISGTHSPLAFSGGVLYAGDYNGRLWAINSSDFTIKWQYPESGSIGIIRYSAPAVSQDGSTVYIGSENGILYAINSTNGILKWSFNTEGTIYASPSLSSDGSVVYIESDYKGIFALDSVNGNEIWPNPALIGNSYGSTAIGPDGAIYAEMGYYLHAVKPDGAEKTYPWPYLLVGGGGNNNAIPAVASDGTVYFYSPQSNYLYSVNLNGTERWKRDLGINGIEHSQSPAIANDGTVYVLSRNNILYAIK